MVRTHGWGPRGQRLRGQAPHGHWQTLTFLAALRHDRIDAPCVLDGPINGESFKAYIEQFLVPTLSPATLFIMDNLGSHKGQAVRQLIGRPRQTVLPAALLARPQPDRAGVLKAQDLAAQGRPADH